MDPNAGGFGQEESEIVLQNESWLSCFLFLFL
jgi:hypothetical protein